MARDPDRFARVLATNTILHTCDPALAGALTWAHHGVGADQVLLQETLLDYVRFYQRSPDIVPSFFLDAVAGPLPAEVLAAYDAPFPDPSYKAGLRQLTALVPLTRNDPGAAIGRATMAVLEQWHRPFLTAYSDGDPATRGWDKVFQEQDPRRSSAEAHDGGGRGPLRPGTEGLRVGPDRRGLRRRYSLTFRHMLVSSAGTSVSPAEVSPKSNAVGPHRDPMVYDVMDSEP